MAVVNYVQHLRSQVAWVDILIIPTEGNGNARLVTRDVFFIWQSLLGIGQASQQ